MNDDDLDLPDVFRGDPTEYFIHLGMFITRFADAEAVLRLHCAWASGLDEGMAGIVFGDLTVQAASVLLVRLLREKGLPADPDLDRALKQLQQIATTRNAILHRGVRRSDTGFVTSKGMPNSRLPSRPVDPTILEAMHGDLAPIMAAMMLARPADYDGWAEWAEGIRIAVREPWRYTPPQHPPR